MRVSYDRETRAKAEEHGMGLVTISAECTRSGRTTLQLIAGPRSLKIARSAIARILAIAKEEAEGGEETS